MPQKYEMYHLGLGIRQTYN